MAVEAVAASVGGIGGAGSIPGGSAHDAALQQPAANGQGIGQPSISEPAPAREASLESRGGRIGGPAESAINRAPPEVSAAPHRSGPSVGQGVLDGVNNLQKGDAAWRAGDAAKGHAANEPSLKVAQREPGPAAAQLKPDASHGLDVAGRPTTQPGKSQNPSFDAMVQQLEQVSGQVVQVSVVSKTTSSFTGSLNKLLSSG